MCTLRFTLKQARTYAGLTQDEMAKLLAIHRSTYMRLEEDVSRATVGQVCKIAQITGIPLSDIFLTENSTLVDKSLNHSA